MKKSLDKILNNARRFAHYEIETLMGDYLIKCLLKESNPNEYLTNLINNYIDNYNKNTENLIELIKILRYHEDIPNIINEKVLLDLTDKLVALNESIMRRMELE